MKNIIAVLTIVLFSIAGIVFAQVPVKHPERFSNMTTTSITKAVNGQFVQTVNTTESCSVLKVQLNRLQSRVQDLNSEIQAAGC